MNLKNVIMPCLLVILIVPHRACRFDRLAPAVTKSKDSKTRLSSESGRLARVKP